MAKKIDGSFDMNNMGDIPRCQQTQRCLEYQLLLLREVANRLGLYDAADFLRSKQ